MLTQRPSHKLAALATLAALTLTLGGCGELAALDDTGDDGGSSIPIEVEDAFAESCALSGCHDSASRAGGLSLDAADLGSLVGKPAGGSDLPLVEIGDVHGSYLAIKMLPDDVLSANALVRTGSRMPTTNDFQNPNNAVILAWIAGAEFPEGGDSEGSSSSTGTSTGDGMPTFDADILAILSPMKCSCHQSAPSGSNGNLSFPPADAYTNLVGVASDDIPGMNLIEPNDPDNSYLLHKLKGTQADVGGAGGLMPIGPPLDAADIQIVEDWINAGAPP